MLGMMCWLPDMEMTNRDWLIVVGLVLDIVGIIGLFFFAPEKHPDPQAGAFFALQDKTIRPRWRDSQRLRARMARLCLGTIAVGFFLQAAAVVIY